MSLLYWTVIFGIIFLGLTFVLTYVAAKRTNDLRDYVVAPTSYGPIWVGLALGATSSSASATMGTPAFVYTYGWSGMWYAFGYGLMVLAWAVSAYQLQRFSRDLGANSLPDFFGKRFKSPFLRVFSAFVVLFFTFYIAAQFVGASLSITELTPMTYTSGIILGTIIIVAYVMIGGAHAEVLNSAVQGAFMVVFGILVIIAGILAVGGIGEMNTAVTSINSSLGWDSMFSGPEFTPFNAPASFISLGLFALTPQLSRLWMALDDEKNVKHTLVVGMFFVTIMYIMTIVGGLAARAVAPGLEVADLATLTLLAAEMPDVVLAFAGISIFAAIMSTTAGLFLTTAVAITNDIYKDTIVPRYYPDADEEVIQRRTDIWTRLLIIVVALVALFIAYHPPEFLTGLMWIGIGAFAAAFVPILIWSSIWDGVTPIAAKVCAVIGFLIHTVGYFGLGNMMGMTLWTVPWRGAAVGILVTFILIPLFSIATKQTLSEDFLNDIFTNESTSRESVSDD